MAISMLKIRRPLGRLIFNMGITIPCKTVFFIETAPWTCSSLSLQMSQHLSVLWTSADTVMTTQSYTQSRKTKIMPMVNWSTKYLHHHKLCWLSIASLHCCFCHSLIYLLLVITVLWNCFGIRTNCHYWCFQFLQHIWLLDDSYCLCEM